MCNNAIIHVYLQYDMQSSADKENSSEDDSDDLYRPPTPKDSVDMSCDHNSSLLVYFVSKYYAICCNDIHCTILCTTIGVICLTGVPLHV